MWFRGGDERCMERQYWRSFLAIEMGNWVLKRRLHMIVSRGCIVNNILFHIAVTYTGRMNR